MNEILTLEQIYAISIEDRADYIAQTVSKLDPDEAWQHLLVRDMNDEQRACYNAWQANHEDDVLADVARRSAVVMSLNRGEAFRKTYCYNRIHEVMGLTEEDYTLPLTYPVGLDGVQTTDRKIFFPDDKDNIHILVYDIDGNVITYPRQSIGHTAEQSASSTRDIEYTVMRRNPKTLDEHNQQHPLDPWPKYRFPSKVETGRVGHFPFFPPVLMKKYADKTPIDTLVLTEGYFKAIDASRHGVDIVGLGSITLYRNPKTRELYGDIKRIIRDCEVKNVVILYDGDCRDISKSALKAMKEARAKNQVVIKDLSERPKVFMSNLRKLTDDLTRVSPKLNVYFSYVNTGELLGEPKGLDDVYDDPHYRNMAAQITKALVEDKTSSTFFRKVNLRTEKKNLADEFYLRDAEQFYDRWKMEIGTMPFVFFNSTYIWDTTNNRLSHQVEERIEDYIHVGNDFYYNNLRPDARNEAGEYNLEARSRTTVNDFFGPEGIRQIIRERHFKGFVNIPGHIDYKASINNHYNIYHPIAWTPTSGECPTILNFLRHIAPDEDEEIYVAKYGCNVINNQFKLLLAYEWMLWNRPTVNLPILCLVSTERRTGKTTYLDLHQLIYGDNVAVVNNKEIQSDFNTLLGGKLQVCVDETSLADNDKFTESIKNMTTAKYLNINAKGKDAVKVANFMKMVLCSNNETNFIYTDSEEVRFWVLKVPALPADGLIPNILDKFREEIPAFLGMLSSMRVEDLIVPEQEDRMWFAPERTHTKALDAVVEDSRSKLEKWVRRYITEFFKDTGKDSVHYDTVTMAEMAKKTNKDADDSKVLKLFKSLSREGKCAKDEKNDQSWYVDDMYIRQEDGTYKAADKKKCRPYIFHISDWLDEETIAKVKGLANAEEAEQQRIVSMNSVEPSIPGLHPTEDPFG